MQLPSLFVERTKEILHDEYHTFEKALEKKPELSVRINDKTQLHPSDDQVAWCREGFYLSERPLFTADPLFHAGTYYVQEASSMFLQQIVLQHFPYAQRVLDLCAAPGGKSTLLAQTLSPDSLLVSNEIVRSRAFILAENIAKWGNPNVAVTNNAPEDFGSLTCFFDAIIVDAPCSGEGMFRKDEGAIREWSVENVNNCVVRQQRILLSAWAALKTDGILVYSTCTYNREENEENVAWICKELGAEKLDVDTMGNNIVASDGGYRFYPHKIRGEGFFISVLKKTSENSSKGKRKPEKSKDQKSISLHSISFAKLKNPEKWKIVLEDSILKAYDKQLFDDFIFINRQLNCIDSGITLAELKGKDYIPAQQLALSKMLDMTNIDTVDINYETAIAYLKKVAINLPDENRGFLLLTFKNVPLGWVKNIGNRCNNLYPQNWRIRMNL